MLVVVEGCDFSGKTTAVNILKELLEEKGHSVVVVRAMGTGELGEVVRAKLLSGYIDKTLGATACCLALLDWYRHVKELSARGYTVISDRGLATYYAYNVKANEDLGANELFDNILDNRSIVDLEPDLLFFIDVTAEEARARMLSAKGNREITHIDMNPIEYYQAVIGGFHEYFNEHRYLPVTSIRNNQDLLHLHKCIHDTLELKNFVTPSVLD